MRVLHIVDSLGRGGAEIIVKGLLEHQRQDPDVFLYVLRSVKNPVFIDHPGVSVNGSESRFSLVPLLALRTWLKVHPIDVLHCHLFRSQVFGWLLKMLFFPKIKLVFHEHGRVFGSELGSAIGDRLYVTFLRIASLHVNGFIAISEATRNRLISRSGIRTDQINVLYNFIDPLFHNAEPRHREQGLIKSNQSSDESAFFVGFAGRLVQRKGWRTFVDAANRLLKRSPAFKFLIAGDGPEKQLVLEAINEKPEKDRVIYLGQVEDMKSFYTGLDCLVVPSFWEPQGLVEIEAQALGVPVVVSNAEALNEIVQDRRNGLLFETGNSSDLAEKILTLRLRPDLREKLATEGLATSMQYDVDRYVIKLRSLYGQILGRDQ